ncbi:hypothetical protein BDP27DRAFT_1373508 [Rhodocollybia butyracea]|uniref:Uncharacterized protein n=1 Tax=Rhodocollybia butyracea TaxID=206335 RepID=A0A9P5P702_9AGAR|nr:hypothetical protein BDP27DRAFT_1373508 [Rhodocollybia butyracea]
MSRFEVLKLCPDSRGFKSIFIPNILCCRQRKDSDLNEPQSSSQSAVTHPSARARSLYSTYSDWEAANKMKTEGLTSTAMVPCGDFIHLESLFGRDKDTSFFDILAPPIFLLIYFEPQFWNYNQRDHGGYGREMKPADFDEIMAKTMITGPMDIHDDVNFTPNFWQYAVIGHRNRNLKYTYSDKLQPVRDIEVHKALCRNVPKGKLSDEKYAEGQKSNPKFEETLDMIYRVVTTNQARLRVNSLKEHVEQDGASQLLNCLPSGWVTHHHWPAVDLKDELKYIRYRDDHYTGLGYTW